MPESTANPVCGYLSGGGTKASHVSFNPLSIYGGRQGSEPFFRANNSSPGTREGTIFPEALGHWTPEE